jgi:plastocyanin
VRKWIPLGLIAAVAMLALAATACGGDDNGDDGGNGGNTPAASATTPASTPDNGGDDGDDGEDGENIFTIVSKNTLFDKTEIEAKAGEITLIEDNQDPGLVHNLHVFKGSDATGDDLGATELEAGPAKQELKLNLEAGDYFYQCDAHPATMSGTLKVE